VKQSLLFVAEGSDGPGRVHFPDDQLQKHDAEIVIQSDEEGQLDVHLGFLQIQHRYQIRFSIKDALGEDIISDPLESLNVRLLEAVPSDDGKQTVEPDDCMFFFYLNPLLSSDLLLDKMSTLTLYYINFD